MSEDLIIGEPSKDPITEEEIVEGEVEWDDTTACGYIDTCMNVICQLDSIDGKIMNKRDELRIKQMKRWSLRIAHHYMKDIYTDLFDEEKNDEE